MASLNPHCTECELHATAKTVCMAGDGPRKNVSVMLIGEAPGANEDKRGVPFIGESGKILRGILERNNLAEKTYITNLVKCRPPNNRTPTAAEIKACRHYLDEEIAQLTPDFVVTAGVPATKTLFRGRAKINQFHGEVIENPKVSYIGMPVFHPAYTLRDPSKLPGLEDDIARLARLIKGGLRNDTVEWTLVRKGNLSTFIREFEEATEFAFDTETAGLRPFAEDGYITAVAIALTHRTWVIPGMMHPEYQRFSHSPFAHGDALRKLMQLLFFLAHRDKKRTYAQNGKFDNKWMRWMFGGSFRLTFDVMLAHHVLDENLAHDLTSMCRTYLDEPEYDISLAEKQGKSEKPMRNYKYCGQDATYTLRLGKLFESMLRQDPGVHRLFWKITMPGARAMEDAEMEGLTIDEAARKEIGLQLLSEMITEREELNDMVGCEVNWNSPAQIGKLLYKDLGYQCKIFTKKGANSTSEEALLSISTKPVVKKLLKFRSASKMFNTYVKGWQQYRVGDKYYFDYKLHGTVTGRYSSPLHPIPRDGKIRNLITAPKGWTLCVLDLATAEMRIAAHLSRDPEMRRCFTHGIDVHWRTMIETLAISNHGEWVDLVWKTAEKMWDSGDLWDGSYDNALDMMMKAGPKECIALEPRWYEGRTRAKAVNFGFIFGMYPKKFIEQAKKDYDWEPTMTEAKNARHAYFRLYSRLEDWHTRTKRLAKTNGHVRCLTGRLRRLPGIQVRDKMVRMESERQAVNSGVQALIGDYKAMLLIEIHQTFPRDHVRLVGEHHDAVLTIVRDEVIPECVPKMLKMAERPKLMDTFKITLSVPMEGEAELGPWGKGEKYAA